MEVYVPPVGEQDVLTREACGGPFVETTAIQFPSRAPYPGDPQYKGRIAFSGKFNELYFDPDSSSLRQHVDTAPGADPPVATTMYTRKRVRNLYDQPGEVDIGTGTLDPYDLTIRQFPPVPMTATTLAVPPTEYASGTYTCNSANTPTDTGWKTQARSTGVTCLSNPLFSITDGCADDDLMLDVTADQQIGLIGYPETVVTGGMDIANESYLKLDKCTMANPSICLAQSNVPTTAPVTLLTDTYVTANGMGTSVPWGGLTGKSYLGFTPLVRRDGPSGRFCVECPWGVSNGLFRNTLNVVTNPFTGFQLFIAFRPTATVANLAAGSGRAMLCRYYYLANTYLAVYRRVTLGVETYTFNLLINGVTSLFATILNDFDSSKWNTLGFRYICGPNSPGSQLGFLEVHANSLPVQTFDGSVQPEAVFNFSTNEFGRQDGPVASGSVGSGFAFSSILQMPYFGTTAQMAAYGTALEPYRSFSLDTRGVTEMGFQYLFNFRIGDNTGAASVDLFRMSSTSNTLALAYEDSHRLSFTWIKGNQRCGVSCDVAQGVWYTTYIKYDKYTRQLLMWTPAASATPYIAPCNHTLDNFTFTSVVLGNTNAIIDINSLQMWRGIINTPSRKAIVAAAASGALRWRDSDGPAGVIAGYKSPDNYFTVDMTPPRPIKLTSYIIGRDSSNAYPRAWALLGIPEGSAIWTTIDSVTDSGPLWSGTTFTRSMSPTAPLSKIRIAIFRLIGDYQTACSLPQWDLFGYMPSNAREQVQADWEENNTRALSYIKNKPTGGGTGTGQVNSDWSATSGVAQILNKPTIPAAQAQSDWTATTGLGVVLNKPTIPAAQVQSNWTATTGLGVVLNKPTISEADQPFIQPDTTVLQLPVTVLGERTTLAKDVKMSASLTLLDPLKTSKLNINSVDANKAVISEVVLRTRLVFADSKDAWGVMTEDDPDRGLSDESTVIVDTDKKIPWSVIKDVPDFDTGSAGASLGLGLAGGVIGGILGTIGAGLFQRLKNRGPGGGYSTIPDLGTVDVPVFQPFDGRTDSGNGVRQLERISQRAGDNVPVVSRPDSGARPVNDMVPGATQDNRGGLRRRAGVATQPILRPPNVSGGWGVYEIMDNPFFDPERLPVSTNPISLLDRDLLA